MVKEFLDISVTEPWVTTTDGQTHVLTINDPTDRSLIVEDVVKYIDTALRL